MMENKKTRRSWPQFYGYMVCLIAVIAFLISAARTVNAVIDKQDPLYASWLPSSGPSLASYENYKMDILRSGQATETTAEAYVPNDATIRTMYEAARADRIQHALHRANRTIIVDGMVIALCVVLFVTHWRWVRKFNQPALN